MDDKDKADSQQIDDDAKVDESPTEEATEEQQEPVEEAPQEKAEEPTEQETEPEAESPPSRRENLRIQSLVAKLRTQQAPNQRESKADMDYRKSLDADDDTYKKLETDRASFGDNRYNEGVKQAESIQFHTRLEIDAPKIASKYPQLDQENKEHFNPAVANAINEWYLATAGYNPNTDSVSNANVRYSDFVEGIMELADEMAGEKSRRASKNVAKQAATTGIRPDGSKATRLNLNKAPGDMSDEELDAVIGQIKI